MVTAQRMRLPRQKRQRNTLIFSRVYVFPAEMRYNVELARQSRMRMRKHLIWTLDAEGSHPHSTGCAPCSIRASPPYTKFPRVDRHPCRTRNFQALNAQLAVPWRCRPLLPSSIGRPADATTPGMADPPRASWRARARVRARCVGACPAAAARPQTLCRDCAGSPLRGACPASFGCSARAWRFR